MDVYRDAWKLADASTECWLWKPFSLWKFVEVSTYTNSGGFYQYLLPSTEAFTNFHGSKMEANLLTSTVEASTNKKQFYFHGSTFTFVVASTNFHGKSFACQKCNTVVDSAVAALLSPQCAVLIPLTPQPSRLLGHGPSSSPPFANHNDPPTERSTTSGTPWCKTFLRSLGG